MRTTSLTIFRTGTDPTFGVACYLGWQLRVGLSWEDWTEEDRVLCLDIGPLGFVFRWPKRRYWGPFKCERCGVVSTDYDDRDQPGYPWTLRGNPGDWYCEACGGPDV